MLKFESTLNKCENGMQLQVHAHWAKMSGEKQIEENIVYIPLSFITHMSMCPFFFVPFAHFHMCFIQAYRSHTKRKICACVKL